MPYFNVYGISDWPENLGEKFIIYKNKGFSTVDEAVAAARDEYYDKIDIVVEKLGE